MTSRPTPPAQVDPVADLVDQWEGFTELLAADDAFTYVGTDEVVEALIGRSVLENAMDASPAAAIQQFARVHASDVKFRTSAPSVLERTHIGLYRDDSDNPAHWWWKVEEIVLGRAGSALMNVPESAAMKGVHPHTIRKAIRLGELPARRLARGFLIERRDLERWEARPAGRPSIGRPVLATDEDPLLDAFNRANTSGDFAKAHSIAAALRQAANSARRCLAVAIDASNAGNNQLALDWAVRAMDLGLDESGSTTAQLVRGRSLLRLSRARDATGALIAATIGNGEVPWMAYADLADAYMAIGAKAKATDAAQKAVAAAPTMPQPRYVLARVDWHCDRVFEALQHVAEYRRDAPDDPNGLLLHGSILGFLGDRTGDRTAYELAMKLFTQAEKTGRLDAVRLLGIAAGRLGQWKRALAAARTLIRLDRDHGPELADQVVRQAWERLDANNVRQLRLATDQATGVLGPAALRAQKAVVDALEGRVDDVLAACDVDLNSVREADAHVRLLVSAALVARGTPADAYSILKIEDYPDQPPALVMIAQSAIAADHPEDAVSALRALASCSGIAGKVAHTALDVVKAVDAQGRHEALGIVARAFAEHQSRALLRVVSSDFPGESPWEGEHPRTSPVLTDLKLDFVH